MKVGYYLTSFLAAAYGNPVAPLLNALLLGYLVGSLNQASHYLAFAHFCQGGDVLPGYHQDVDRGLRVNVGEGYDQVVLIYQSSRYFASYYAAEDTIGVSFKDFSRYFYLLSFPPCQIQDSAGIPKAPPLCHCEQSEAILKQIETAIDN